MEPNKWGLIRNKKLNLVALPFLINIFNNIQEYHVEEIPVEWIQGGYPGGTTGTITANNNFSYSITDVSDYDYVIYPISGGVGIFTGLKNNDPAQTLTPRIIALQTNEAMTYSMLDVNPSTTYMLYTGIRSVNVNRVVVLGLKRHRSDGVNPEG